ncbi:MAG TPA: 30S ribosomal protein S6 [Candidatus Paceibacterota bacterium]
MVKKGEQISEEQELDSGEARVYELGFHLDPGLASDEVKGAYQAVRTLVESKGEVVAEGEPEKVALAYTVSRAATAGRQDFDAAYFAWITYEATVGAHEEIVKAAGAESRIIRFIDLVSDRDTARAASARAELADKVPEHPTESEAVSEDVALDAALESVTL